MAGMITRCPKCATAFRISDTHLKSAKGMVRCGNCLEVFDANLHLQRKAEQAQPSPTAKPKLTPEQAPAQVETAAPPPERDPTPPGAVVTDPQTRDRQDLDTAAGDPDETIEEDDEAWALELLKDDTDLNIKLKKIVSAEEQKTQPTAGAVAGFSQPPQNQTTTTEPEPVDPASFTDDPLTDEALAKEFVPPKPLHEMLSAIEDPLEVAYEDPAARWRKRLTWGGLSLLAGLALMAQVAWLEFYRLATVEPYRKLYGEVCDLLGCTLPEQVDRSAIATSNLIIRSHPSREDALVVDVILENRADFEQTFPGIVLTFTDLHSQPVATRRFEPREYLGGELAGSTHMPVAQPIHIGFEIHDPGSDAQSYHIAIVD